MFDFFQGSALTKSFNHVEREYSIPLKVSYSFFSIPHCTLLTLHHASWQKETVKKLISTNVYGNSQLLSSALAKATASLSLPVKANNKDFELALTIYKKGQTCAAERSYNDCYHAYIDWTWPKQ